MTATARRLVELNDFPCILVSYGANGRRWFTGSKLVPERWFPIKELDQESDAFNAVFSGETLGRPTKIGADAFFDRTGADRYEMLEETILIGRQDALTLLTCAFH